MNDNISLFLATTILAVGGLGLYMFKSSNDNQSGGDDEEYNEDGLFGSENFLNWGNNQDTGDNQDDDFIFEEDEIKPRKRGGRTQRNRKSGGRSKRRY